MIIISDTSPIINLAVIGRLDILPKLFGTVVIPKEVFEEITANGKDEPGSEEIRNANWISVQESQNKELIHTLQEVLDQGESSAIALAIELNADYLLIDESLGREYAKEYNVHVMGLIGVLFEAKKQGIVLEVMPIVDSLMNEAGFWISKSLLNEIHLKDKK
ncbi:MAG: DUF3368 domain-containing protein [Leptospiraceae bacterium]|nr:DUF3368 domain-containing protein [Leptospiraceae bacterium]